MKNWLNAILLLTFVASGSSQFAYADVIPTETALVVHQHDASVARVNDFLSRADVSAQLVQMGVDPHHAMMRVDALTMSELTTLEQHLNDLPAGGAGIVGIIGVVAVVLIILELLGVTNVFTSL